MKTRPSSLPIQKVCPKFESGPARDFTNEGTKRHNALESMFNDPDGILSDDWSLQLDDESIEGIGWAYDYINVHAPLRDHQLNIERKLQILDDDFEKVMEGTLDYQCGNHLFDIKWRRRNYREQMACYALMMIQELGLKIVKVHILFMESKHAEKFTLTEQQCWEIINPVTEACKDPDAKANPNEYCGWCKHHLYCDAVNERVETVVDGREDWELEKYHASQIKEPEELAKAIAIARTVKKWAEAVEHFAKDFIFSGGEIPGYAVRPKAGRRVIESIAEAFDKSGLEQHVFLDCCTVKFSSLVEKRQALHGISKKVAEKEIERMLGDVCSRAKPSYELRKTPVKKN